VIGYGTPVETDTPVDAIERPKVSLVKKVDEVAVATDEEKPGRRLTGRVRQLVDVVAIGIALFALYEMFRPLSQGSQYYLIIFLGLALPLVFLLYRSGLPQRDPDRPSPVDWVFAALALVTCLYPVLPVAIGEAGGGYDAFLDRQGLLAPLDVVMGAVLLLLILEATRRTTGWILPAVCLVFLAYGYYGGYIPQSWEIAHAGLDFAEIVDALYNSGSGFYGTPLDVAASYILLFTIYGAALELGGAGKFFVDLSVAAFRESGSAPGRTAVAAGFLLGTVSGSGASTTVVRTPWPSSTPSVSAANSGARRATGAKRHSSSRPFGTGKSATSNDVGREARDASGAGPTPWVWLPSATAREWSVDRESVVVVISRRPLPSAAR